MRTTDIKDIKDIKDMKDVTLRITGKHVYYDTEEEQLELITDGKLCRKGEKLLLSYDESEFSGLEGCSTCLTLSGGSVSMSRRGDAVGIDTEIRFEKGKRYNGFYDTPYGPIEMEVLTNDLENTVDDSGNGHVNIDYSISFRGMAEGRSRLNIEVKEGSIQ